MAFAVCRTVASVDGRARLFCTVSRHWSLFATEAPQTPRYALHCMVQIFGQCFYFFSAKSEACIFLVMEGSLTCSYSSAHVS